MMRIQLMPDEWAELNDHLGEGNKIQAIKLVRRARLHMVHDAAGTSHAGISLLQAKDAVEDLVASRAADVPGGRTYINGGTAIVVPLQPIKRIVCDFGDGEVEVDMEGMSLRILTGMNGSVPLSVAGSLIDLYGRVKEWEKDVIKNLK